MIRLLLTSIVFLTAPVVALSSDLSPDSRYDRFLEASESIINSDDYDVRLPLITSAYQSAVAGFDHNDALSVQSDRDVHFLQLTAEAALHYGAGDEVADDAERFFNEASRRSDEAKAAPIYYRSMLLAGRWKAASSVEPLLPAAMPIIHVDASPSQGNARTVLVADGLNRLREEDRFPLADGVYIIGHESCAWTRRALSDLQGDIEATAFISEKAMFLSPANTVLQGVRSEGSNFAIVLRVSDWPEIRNWSLPSFVFVHNGKVVDHFSGWPGPERIKTFHAGMMKITPSMSSEH